MEKNINWQMKRHYESVLKVFEAEEQKTSLIYHLCDKLPNYISWVASYVKTDEEKNFVRKCEENALKLYQRSLDYNYEKLQEYKETKLENDKDFMYLSLTVDKEGNPIKTKVIDVDFKKGTPIFEDDCILIDVNRKMTNIYNNIKILSKWLNKKDTLQEILDDALKLKEQGSLGTSGSPTTNYNMDGMSREQRDAQAWENYVIESGRYRITNYDWELDELITNLEECISFYKKAISIF